MLYIFYNSFTNLSVCLFSVNSHIWVCVSKSYSRPSNVSSLSGYLVVLIFIFNADQQITFLQSFFYYYYISGKSEAPSSSSLEWYYIGGPLAAVVFLLALISYIKKRRETGKMLPYENKMSSYGRLWLLIRQCFGARRSYFKQVIFCISSTDFEGPSTVPAKPITNQITKTLQII